MLKTNSEAFKKEATAASEKSRNLQVANSKIQATLDSTLQVTVKYFVRKILVWSKSVFQTTDVISGQPSPYSKRWEHCKAGIPAATQDVNDFSVI